MSRYPTIFRQAAATGGDFGLPPDLVVRARKRLAGLAGLLGGLSGLTLFLGLAVFETPIDSRAATVHLGNVVLTAGIVAVALWRRVSASVALTIGLAFEVLMCWAVSFAANFGVTEMVGQPPHMTWTTVIIVVFPIVVPLPPRRLLIASILAALSSPVSVYAMGRAGLFEPSWEHYLGLSMSPAFAVIIAYFGARMIYSISRDVTEARQMGAYRLESKLGAGGMGEVWRASHRMLARPAAVKLIAPARLGSDEHVVDTLIKRFEQEAQATALLRSPHTVEVYDFGVASDGSFYYVMELLDGLDFERLVEDHGPLPASRVVYLLRQVCHSLGEAHEAGLIHRDIKPANIFTCRYGSDYDFVKVLDFGLVKERALGEGVEELALTQHDRLVGTPAFLPPEAALGDHLDGRADLYALGCVGYWLLTGTLVFEGDTAMAVVAKHLKDEPEPPSRRTELAIPADLERVILACLEKEPDDRPGSAEELATRLADCDAGGWGAEDARRWWRTVRPG